MKITYTLMLNEEEVDVDFDIDAHIVYRPEQVSGPVENCYPDESECDIRDIKVLSEVDGFTDLEILAALEGQIGTDKIGEDLWEDFLTNDRE